MSERLLARRCIPCKGGVPPLDAAGIAPLEKELGEEWDVIDGHHLFREFKFKNFAQALAFTDKIGAISEEQNHHPDIHLSWGSVAVEIWTHKINGLTESDFVLAAKFSQAYSA